MMSQAIVFKVEDVELRGHLADTPTARLISAALPLEGLAQRWGEEYYFEVPIEAELEEGADDLMSPGELGYWPVGRALCLFWGPTPASQEDEIRAASPVNLVGRVAGDFAALSGLPSQARVRVEKA